MLQKKQVELLCCITFRLFLFKEGGCGRFQGQHVNMRWEMFTSWASLTFFYNETLIRNHRIDRSENSHVSFVMVLETTDKQGALSFMLENLL